MNALLIMTLIFAIGILSWLYFYNVKYLPLKQKDIRQSKRNEDYNKLNLRHQGATGLYYPPNWNINKDGRYFNYDLRSFDGGKNWYAVELVLCDDGLWGFYILGNARELYPNLIEHIENMDELTKYVQKNGTIDGTNLEGIEVLKKAGFTIIKNE